MTTSSKGCDSSFHQVHLQRRRSWAESSWWILSEQLKDSDYYHTCIHCFTVWAVIKCLLQSVLDAVLQHTVSPSSLLCLLWRAAVFRTSWGPRSAPWGTRGSAGGSDKHPSFINTELTGETSPAPPCGQHHTLHPPPAQGQSPDGESQMSFSLVIMFNVCRRDDWTCGAVLISTSFKLTVDPFITTGF